MPKRHLIFADFSAEQGEGAYAMLRPLTWGQQRAMQETIARLGTPDGAPTPEFIAANDAFTRAMVGHVEEWNLVDDEGKPLLLPEQDADVLDALTIAEVMVIVQTLSASVATSKN